MVYSTSESDLSSSFHRLHMTLAVAEALSPSKPNQHNQIAEPETVDRKGNANLLRDSCLWLGL